MLPDRVMRGKESSEFQARHGGFSGCHFLFVERRGYVLETVNAIARCPALRNAGMRVFFPLLAVVSRVLRDRICAICARRPCRFPVLFTALITISTAFRRECAAHLHEVEALRLIHANFRRNSRDSTLIDSTRSFYFALQQLFG
ncbi:hypothetical protein [Bradyrhizobium cosmicum]|uniref:hypothetical protein n=1 Tax=Bradyrhizobium cosmicum TaxID=1404864 RepID=UPI00143CE1D6|nr:hypothetical protein [Bradyrhizobium cosmicum]